VTCGSAGAQLLPVISRAVEEGLLRWLRAAELTCDRAALLVTQVSVRRYIRLPSYLQRLPNYLLSRAI
jgi:hypothetical protein